METSDSIQNVWSINEIIHFKPFHRVHHVERKVSKVTRRAWKRVRNNQISSVKFSCSVMSDSLQPQSLQHTRLPCPSLTPGAHSNLCPLSSWCHAIISSSVVPFSSRLQSLPASEYFPVSQFFTSPGQSIGASTSVSVLPMSVQDRFPLRSTGLIWQSKGLLIVSQHHSSTVSVLWCSTFLVI